MKTIASSPHAQSPGDTPSWLHQMIRRLFGSWLPAPQGRRCRRPGRVRLSVEVLEAREVPSANVWNFVTQPYLHPMKVSVQVEQPGLAPGLVFVGPYAAYPDQPVGQTGPLIMDNAGNPVWFLPVSSTNKEQVTDFRVQSYQGQPVLTWWQGQIAGAVPSNLPNGSALPGSRFVVYNNHYQKIMTITAQDGFRADVHEFLITPQGTAIFTAIRQVPADLTPYGGTKYGSYMDYAVQEIDLRTGKLLFEWDIRDHVPLSDSMVAAPTSPGEVWDPYHMNSIDVSPDGKHLLLSSRDCWMVFQISHQTGQIEWRLGGKENQFTFPPGAAFQWQHDARYVAGGISMFDDASFTDIPGHGLILNVNLGNFTASVRNAYFHDPLLYPDSQGDMQVLPNGNEFIGWGAEPYYSEYSHSGTLLYDVLMPGENVTYRAFRNTWVGIPLTKPAIAVHQGNGQAVIFCSWNGSTETAAWRLLAGTSPYALLPISVTARTGFETAISTGVTARFYEVEALDTAGNVLGTSAVVRTAFHAWS